MGLVQNIATSIKNAWDAVEEMGGAVPENKNLANLPAGIMSIPTGPLPPGVPTTLEELKQMVNRGREIAVGTEIEDTYNGQSNPWIVVANLNDSNVYKKADDSNFTGAILQRKFITNVGQVWNNYGSNQIYRTSAINTYLNNTYLNNCSTQIKEIIDTVKIPSKTTTSLEYVQAKISLPSVEEVYGDASQFGGAGQNQEGQYFEYWKNKTKLSNPSNTANTGRVATLTTGTAQNWWLRSAYFSTGTTGVWYVATNSGALLNAAFYETNIGILPICFIGKD